MEITLSPPNSIRTFTGLDIDILNPTPEMINIEDIAHSLACTPRFGGHLPEPYSVAQHSISCMRLVPDEFKLEALLHDASEAYLGDMPRPIKIMMPDYQRMEKKLQSVISDKYKVSFPMSEEVKKVDNEMLILEWKVLMLREDCHKLKVLSCYDAKKEFLHAFRVLLNNKK